MDSDRRERPPAPRASGSRSVRLLTVLAIVAGLVQGTGEWSAPLVTSLIASPPPPPSIQDSDHDGLNDNFETYLATASNAPEFATSSVNADSDGDGQPDGFEYCLSGGTEIYSPNKVHAVVPKVTLGSYQLGDQLHLILFVVPGDLSAIDAFHLFVAVEGANGAPIMLDLTEIFAVNIQAVGLTSYGPYTMGVFQTSIPISSAVGLFPSFAVMPLGSIAGIPTGDSATFTVHQGRAYRWRYTPKFTLDPEDDVVEGEAEPQDAEVEPGAVSDEVCKTTEVTNPTSTPGVLERVTTSAGCDGGKWTCVASVCTALVGKKVIVLDHLDFLN